MECFRDERERERILLVKKMENETLIYRTKIGHNIPQINSFRSFVGTIGGHNISQTNVLQTWDPWP